MKDFLKFTLASVSGIVITLILFCIIGVCSIVGMLASEQATTQIEDNSVLVLSLDGALDERNGSIDFMGYVRGEQTVQIGLDDILTAIDKAKDNDNIKGIYIEEGMFSPDGVASVQAIRNKLEEFRKSGKWIVAYGDQYTQMGYYIASVADKIFINPEGMVDWHGLAAAPMFLKDALAKFGVKVQLSKVGKYKSAPEMLTADKMSDANREQVSAYINGIWNVMLDDVSKSRNISKGELNVLADNFAALSGTKEYVKHKLVDKTLYYDEVKGEIRKLLKIGANDDVTQVSVEEMLCAKDVKRKEGDEVAVYYCFGDVVDGDGAKDGSSSIASGKVCRDLAKLADDDDVKAVVLRINSGGGSAYASEQICHYVSRLAAQKPVVVSMGSMAASGAYYISAPANYIFAEPTTLTGSIGIFGMFPDYSGLLTDKLGVKFDEVKTNKHSAFGTRARPFNEEEMSLLNNYIERGYKLFRLRVAEGRNMKVEEVEKIAQGRVWLGSDALKVKLVDELGGMDKAIAKAAKLAKLEEYHTNAYPAKKSTWDALLDMVSEEHGNYLDNQLRSTLGEYYAPFMYLRNLNKQSAIQARIPFELNIK